MRTEKGESCQRCEEAPRTRTEKAGNVSLLHHISIETVTECLRVIYEPLVFGSRMAVTLLANHIDDDVLRSVAELFDDVRD